MSRNSRSSGPKMLPHGCKRPHFAPRDGGYENDFGHKRRAVPLKYSLLSGPAVGRGEAQRSIL